MLFFILFLTTQIFDQGKSRIGVVQRPDSTQLPPSNLARSLNPWRVKAASSSLLQARSKGSSSGDSSATSLGIMAASSFSSSSLMYATFILLATMLSPKGSMRYILAGCLSLVLLLRWFSLSFPFHQPAYESKSVIARKLHGFCLGRIYDLLSIFAYKPEFCSLFFSFLLAEGHRGSLKLGCIALHCIALGNRRAESIL